MSSSSLEIAKQLGLEISAYTQPDVSNTAFYENLAPGDLEESCHRLMQDANQLIQCPLPGATSPSFELTEKALAISQEASLISPEGASINGTCFQAELRFCRALAHAACKTPANNRLPSALLLDASGEPFAFQKADGYPSAYAWRAANYQTKSGIWWIPEGAIFEPTYDSTQAGRTGVYASDPRNQHKDARLVIFEDTIPQTARLKRLSAEYFPVPLREVAFSDAALDSVTLSAQYDNALSMNTEAVERAVAPLIDRAIRV